MLYRLFSLYRIGMCKFIIKRAKKEKISRSGTSSRCQADTMVECAYWLTLSDLLSLYSYSTHDHLSTVASLIVDRVHLLSSKCPNIGKSIWWGNFHNWGPHFSDNHILYKVDENYRVQVWRNNGIIYFLSIIDKIIDWDSIVRSWCIGSSKMQHLDTFFKKQRNDVHVWQARQIIEQAFLISWKHQLNLCVSISNRRYFSTIWVEMFYVSFLI